MTFYVNQPCPAKGIKPLGNIDHFIGVDIEDRRLPIASADDLVLAIDMNMPVQEIARLKHPQKTKEDLEAGVRQVRPVMNSVGG